MAREKEQRRPLPWSLAVAATLTSISFVMALLNADSPFPRWLTGGLLIASVGVVVWVLFDRRRRRE